MPINDHHQFAHAAMQKQMEEALKTHRFLLESRLLLCLFDCAGGRQGLFTLREDTDRKNWPEAATVRTSARFLGDSHPLSRRFLELCKLCEQGSATEAELARTFADEMQNNAQGFSEPAPMYPPDFSRENH